MNFFAILKARQVSSGALGGENIGESQKFNLCHAKCKMQIAHTLLMLMHFILDEDEDTDDDDDCGRRGDNENLYLYFYLYLYLYLYLMI